ncbi:polyamine ABC transporter substrate-binding protein [Actinomadura scrupuli]|uniref:polyamine ABC transporter substrate-binding protein n=1 Tax=Actinomadura scrupuli TaxID=559629 RepID=UPI003D953E85
MNEQIDPALLRGLTQSRYDRRDIFKMFGAAGAGLALAACGVKGKKVAPPKQSDVEKYWAGKAKTGHLDFANWPLYMDPKHPELKKFTQQTGISVNYKEVIQDNNSWFAKIQPQLAAGKSINYDLMVVTNGIEFSELVELGYLAPLDHTKLPNYAKNAGAQYKSESFDPGNVHSIPWTSGLTGIAYNSKYITTPPTSMADLWNPKYKGKVGMMADPQELGNFGLFALGVDPEKSTADDWAKAAAKLKTQRDQGIVRKYYDQDYIKALSSGDIWITMAWSGDIFQQNISEHTNLKFVIPQEGATIWTDNMMIPKTAANPVDAIMLMDFFYDPQIAAELAEYINYVTPVPAAQQVIQAAAAKASGDDKKALEDVATSELVFPTPADYAKLKHYRSFKDNAEKQKYLSLFQPITQS